MQNSKCILPLIIFSRAVHPSPLPHGLSLPRTPSAGGGRVDGSSHLHAQPGRASPLRSEVGSVVWAPLASPPSPNPSPSCASSSPQTLPRGCGECHGKASDGPVSLHTHPNTDSPSAGERQGDRRERGQKAEGGSGGKGGEQEKQDDRTLAPQPSAKLQTSLLRWKAAVS